jgi:hypothetical protein
MMRPIRHLAVATLYFNKTLWQFERNLQRMIAHAGKHSSVNSISLMTRDGMAVDMARQAIVGHALEENCDAVVWLDTDMLYPDHAITRLVQMSNDGHQIAAGLYRRARPPYQILTTLHNLHTYAELDEIKAQAVDGVTRAVVTAGGFSIVRTELYYAIAQQVGLPWYCNWDFRSGDGECGEDRFFCYRAHDVGVYPVVDPDLHALHWPPATGPVPVTEDDPLLRLTE